MIKKSLLAILAIVFFVTSCSNDDNNPVISTKDFTVTIENVFQHKTFQNNGVFDAIPPGGSQSFSFNAGKGSYLSFSTMFVKSNDLFYGFSDTGLELYDMTGNAVTGDVTSNIMLWDAGTEVNEEPGIGANQPMNQTGPNTGIDENSVVHLENDMYDYPMTNTVIKVTLAHDGGTMFTATVENLSSTATITTPLAPGAWAVHNNQANLFINGATASVEIEKLAEDGDNSIDSFLMSNSGYFSPFAPGAYSIGGNTIFMNGQPAVTGLEGLAEDGNASGYANVFNTPNGAGSPGPIFPSGSYSFTFSANETDNLSFALMLVQSNDWFVGADAINLFLNGSPISGDITSMLDLYYAGTEIDEHAGSGNNQPPRQMGSNSGVDENGNTVIETNAGSHVPSVSEMIKVTITSN